MEAALMELEDMEVVTAVMEAVAMEDTAAVMEGTAAAMEGMVAMEVIIVAWVVMDKWAVTVAIIGLE